MKKALILLLATSFLVLTSCGKNNEEEVVNTGNNEIVDVNSGNEETIGIANPASTYCVENGGKSVIGTDIQGNQYGICKFEDGSACEEWTYFNGYCKPASEEEDNSGLIEENNSGEVESGNVEEENTGVSENTL